MSDLELLNALGIDPTAKKKPVRTVREERIIAGFEEIQRFVEKHDQPPRHGEEEDIFERLYAMRLDRIRTLQECRELVLPLDDQGLLDESIAVAGDEIPDDATLLAQLGVKAPREGDVTYLKHVKPRAETRAVESVANRTPCDDFTLFGPIFTSVQTELANGTRRTQSFEGFAEIKQGDLFILYGQKVYVAEVGEYFLNQNGKRDSRLRVIYDNGTESDILLRSLQRALNKDETGRRIVEARFFPHQGSCLEEEADTDEPTSGTIYVLRSQSDHPVIARNRDFIHKIGVTGGDVKRRIADASKDTTFLMADVELVATYELYNIHRQKLEQLLHRFFDSARLEIEIQDRFGRPVVPKEWFLLPLFVIDAAVEKIKNGTISQYYYDVESASLLRHPL